MTVDPNKGGSAVRRGGWTRTRSAEPLRPRLPPGLDAAPQPIPEPIAPKAPPKPEPPKDNGIPFKQIVAAYEAALPMLPRVRTMSDTTKGLVRTRWHDDKVRQDVKWWQQYFEYVRDNCPHLVGKSDAVWFADFQWLVRPTNMEKVINGRYERR